MVWASATEQVKRHKAMLQKILVKAFNKGIFLAKLKLNFGLFWDGKDFMRMTHCCQQGNSALCFKAGRIFYGQYKHVTELEANVTSDN